METSTHHNGQSQEGGELKEELKNKARQAVDEAKSAVDTGKDKLVDGAAGVARALHHASEGLRGDEQSEIAGYTQGVAEKIEQLAEALKNRDLSAIANDVKRLAHRQPALFLGGAFTAGIVAARFLKSSGGGSTNLPALGQGSAASRSPSSLSRSDEMTQSSMADDFGPAPGGYGPAGSPAAAMGGSGTFGSEGTGGDAEGRSDLARQSPFDREE